jgi:hypothetical protein
MTAGSRIRGAVVALVVSLVGLGATAGAAATEPGASRNFRLVGHNGLYRRGMNAAPAIYKDFLYIGNRTDGSPGHPHPGVLVVDIGNPRDPRIVGEIGPPHEGVPSQTSRELRVWPEQKLLMVMNFTCSTFLHACVPGNDKWNIKFYDIGGRHAANPKLVSTYVPTAFPHEMFLWVDPERDDRALLYISTPTNDVGPPNLIVTDISQAREGRFNELVEFTVNNRYTAQERAQRDVALHSLGVSADGRRAYIAHLGGGFLILDTSELAKARPNGDVELLTPVHNSPRWPNQTVHSAVKVPGRELALTTDEIYGDLLDDFAFEDHGCPWGWVHLVNISNEAHPRVVGQFQIEENTQAYCNSDLGQDPANTWFTSFSVHNPTVLRDIALATWHSGGLQAFSIANAAQPRQTGFFSPEPLAGVATEDPALSQGLNKVVMWSYPIIKDGLIYVVDLRNGLYVLRYTGPRAGEIASIDFLEGNSNLGDALALELGGGG